MFEKKGSFCAKTREKEAPKITVTKKKRIIGILKGHESNTVKKKVHNRGPRDAFQVLF